jgi:o-succinylbenzoate synthase
MTSLKAEIRKHALKFIRPATTSRNTLITKDVWYVRLSTALPSNKSGFGEIAPIIGLSFETEAQLEQAMSSLLAGNLDPESYIDTPSVKMALETAYADLNTTRGQHYFDSSFAEGLSGQLINGLIWMGDSKFMIEQISSKLELGFTTLKLKIGTLDFKSELDILRLIRERHSANEITIRVDANGAFARDASVKLAQLAELDLHSIEQPIQAGNWEDMAKLCATTPLDIALDEELIGVHDSASRQQLLSTIKPQYIILKPSLLGGFSSCDEWIGLAEAQGCSWWATSALESNLGLNAIAQWTATKNNPLPQGLGTGKLFENNAPSRLELSGEQLFHRPNIQLDFNSFWNGLDKL